MYRFMGIYREQLWFDSPNLAACFLAMLIMLCIGLFLSMIKRENIYCKIAAIIPATITVMGQFLLVCTYSRGGYVAMAIGLLVMLWLSRSKWIFGFAGVFALLLLLIENGAVRVGTIGHLSDGSIHNRLLLWRGGLAIIADNWLSGMGLGWAIGREYTAWFQPLWLDESYLVMLNDFLTLTCGWGIFASGGILVGVAFIFFWGWRVQRVTKSMILTGMLSSITVFVVCGFFSTMMHAELLCIFFLVSLAITLAWCIAAVVRRVVHWHWSNVGKPLLFAVAFCTIFILACQLVRGYFPYKYRREVISEGQPFEIIIATPSKIKRSIVFAVDQLDYEWLRGKYIRNIIRPLLDEGNKVYFAEIDSGRIGLLRAGMLLSYALKDSPEPLTVIASGIAGKQLFISVAQNGSDKIKQIIVYNMPESWPFDDLSPMNFVERLNVPATFITTAPDIPNRLQKRMRDQRKTVSEYIPHPQETQPVSLVFVLNSTSLYINN